MSDIAIRAEGLSKQYHIGAVLRRERTFREVLTAAAAAPFRRIARLLRGQVYGAALLDETIWALRDVSFEVQGGRILGIIGRNGAGKSTLLKVLSRITAPTEGRAEIRGRVGSLLEVGTGFHPELTGRENTYLNGAILGMKKLEIDRKFDEIVAFAEVEKFIDTPVKHYSSGMYLRLAFAVAAHLEPEILLVDEVLAVGDVNFQKKCLGKMEEVGGEGRTVLFVSHNTPAVLRLCDTVMLLEEGKVSALGPALQVVHAYLRADTGTTAERVWADPARAPGDGDVRLKAVRVCNANGRVAEAVDIREPVRIEIEYWKLRPGGRPSANIHLVNEEGVRLFVSADFNDPGWRTRPRYPGIIRSSCLIPGNLLAEGQILVTACVSSFNPSVGHVRERDLVAFQVVDRTAGDGARGEYANTWPGVIRPVLGWTVEFQPAEEAEATE